MKGIPVPPIAVQNWKIWQNEAEKSLTSKSFFCNNSAAEKNSEKVFDQKVAYTLAENCTKKYTGGTNTFGDIGFQIWKRFCEKKTSSKL